MKTILLFRIVYVPEEFLIEDEEDGSNPDFGDIGTKLGELEEDLGESDETLDHACLSDIQEQGEEWVIVILLKWDLRSWTEDYSPDFFVWKSVYPN